MSSGSLPLLALNGPERVAGQCLLPGVEQTCRSGGPRSQFDPFRTSVVRFCRDAQDPPLCITDVVSCCP
jgi:hypothetical protein